MDEKVLSALAMGVIISTSPLTLQMLPHDFTYPLLAQVSMAISGVLMLAGGLYEAGADRYKIVLSAYVLAGTGVFILGPLTGYPVGQEIWITISFMTALFLGLPSVALLHLSRRSS